MIAMAGRMSDSNKGSRNSGYRLQVTYLYGTSVAVVALEGLKGGGFNAQWGRL